MGAIRLLSTLADMTGVTEAAQRAQATADNARQMVLNRDPKLTALENNTAALAQQQTALEALAAQLSTAVPASEATHAAMRKERADGDAALAAALPSFGYQATTALALLATKDYTVTLSRPMTGTYTAKPVVDPALAGKLNAVVTAQTATTVTVRTTALVAVAAGGFLVIAWP